MTPRLRFTGLRPEVMRAFYEPDLQCFEIAGRSEQVRLDRIALVSLPIGTSLRHVKEAGHLGW